MWGDAVLSRDLILLESINSIHSFSNSWNVRTFPTNAFPKTHSVFQPNFPRIFLHFGMTNAKTKDAKVEEKSEDA